MPLYQRIKPSDRAAQLAADYAAVMAQVTDGTDIVGIISLDPADLAILTTWRNGTRETAATTTIDLSNTGLKGPLIFANLAALTNLTLTGNTGMVTPPDVSTCTALTLLVLYGCTNITTPPDVSLNAALTTLYLSGCPITTPPDVSTCTALAYLDLNGCPITTPPDVSSNTALTYLRLSGCTNLTTPPDVSSNTALTYLRLSGCTGLDADDLFAVMTDLTTAGVGAHSCAINISGIVPPNAATMALIYALCGTGATVYCDAPATVTGTAGGAVVAAQNYVYTITSGTWEGATDAAEIHHDGTNYVLKIGATVFTGPADSIYGDYTLGNDTITISEYVA
jgi:hypothetical protein